MRKAYFITGTDTDAGKTVITCGLAGAFAALGHRVQVVKAVQTGCTADGKAPDVEQYLRMGVEAKALLRYRMACSPHLAASIEAKPIDTQALARQILAEADREGILLCEGAGGLFVPLNDREHMIDLISATALPVLLVVGNRLGCINHALLSLDAMQKRGIDVAGMVLCRTASPDNPDNGTDGDAEAAILAENAAWLEKEGKHRGTPLLASIPWDGRMGSEHHQDALNALAATLAPAARHLADWSNRLPAAEVEALLEFDRKHLWHPYTSTINPLKTHCVTGARGCRLQLADGQRPVDGMSSWWCRVHGYGNRRIIDAMQQQCAQLSHVMFGGLTHEPAVKLGKKLLAVLPNGLEHLFYADSGSVAVEVAMKMAIQYAKAAGHTGRTRFVSLRNAYHGDTIGAMSLCDPVTGMHTLFKGMLPEQIFVEQPACRFPGTSLMHGAAPTQADLADGSYQRSTFEPMEKALREHAHEVAAVFVEPVVQGAGGMWFYHPSYIKDLRALCDELGILLVADEIATGFGRTGRLFACEWAGVTPDILCCGKALSGGMMTFSAVATTARVASGISQARPEQGGGIFMHGPTFMGNPLACATALASLEELLSSAWQERVATIEQGLREGLAPCCGKPGVSDVRVLGAIGVVEMRSPVNVEKWQDLALRHGAWIRPFGKTAYIMPPFTISPTELGILCSALSAAVDELGGN